MLLDIIKASKQIFKIKFMKILVHSIYFHPEVGGLETHVLTLCQALKKRGHSITVVTSHSIPNTPKYEVIDGIHVHRIWCPSKSPIGWIITSFLAIPKMWRISREADIIHSHTFASIVPAILPRWFQKIPLIATLHTSHFLRLAQKTFWKPILRFLIYQPDIIFSASIEICDVAKRLAPKIEAYALVNAVDTERFRPVKPTITRQANEKIIIVPRRLFEKNGVEFAIKALPFIREKIDAHLHIIGDGPLLKELKNLADNLGMTKYVFFHGKKPNIEMPGYLCSADVIVIPSLMEATSVACLEAMACEKPIVASNVGGLPEIVTNDTGKLAEAGNPHDIARKVIEILEMPEEKKLEMGKNARKIVSERWNTDALAETIEKFYIMATERAKKK